MSGTMTVSGCIADDYAHSLVIYMTKHGERGIRDAIDREFGKLTHVVIDVDGEQYKYDAETLISLLERYESKEAPDD